jgi:hypothetical protein
MRGLLRGSDRSRGGAAASRGGGAPELHRTDVISVSRQVLSKNDSFGL